MLTNNNKIPKRQLFLLASDFVVLAIAPFVALCLFFWINLGAMFSLGGSKFHILPSFTLINIIIFMIVIYLFGLYNCQQDFRKKTLALQIILAVIVGSMTSTFLLYLLGVPPQGRGIFSLYLAAVLIGIYLVRYVYSLLGSTGMYDQRTLILGCGESGRGVLKMIQENILKLCFI